MRKFLFVLFLIVLLLLSGCNKNNTPVSESSDTASVISTLTDTEKTESEKTAPKRDTEKDTSKTDTTAESQKDTTTAKTDTTSQSSTETKPTSNTETTKAPEKENNSTETEKEPDPIPTVPNATSADVKEISALVAKYINDYRAEQNISAAVVLPKLTEYAERRSVQIISDFSHNTLDERAAATAMSYGKYIDPALYGMDGEPYYTACAGEAIAKAGYVGTIDHVARSLARLIRNSQEHWCYVGASDYKYIGVGITYESGMWYCDVALTRENFG